MAATHSEETTEQAIRSVCERVGITSLKEKQREALKAIVCNKKDTFICLPTGYGKSLCYALLPLLFDKLLCREDAIVICISPLTAIMMEQRNKRCVTLRAYTVRDELTLTTAAPRGC